MSLRICLTVLLALLLLQACAQAPQAAPPPSSRRPYSLPAVPAALLYKDPALARHALADSSGIALFASEAARRAGTAEVKIYPEEYAAFADAFAALPDTAMLALLRRKGLRKWTAEELAALPPMREPFRYGQDTLLPLKGLRVALDPGHSAGSLAEAVIEGKAVRMQPSARTGGQAVGFYEAHLTLVTAHLIRQQLEAMGAEVFMTRSQPGLSALGTTFAQWKQQQLGPYLQSEVRAGRMSADRAAAWKQAPDADLFFKLYNPLDLRTRAAQINAFRPHLTLIIHYNVHEPNWRKAQGGYVQPAPENYCMAFVPGAFMPGELGSPEERLALLRLLLTQDLPASLALSDAFVRSSDTLTGVPPVAAVNPLPYLNQYSAFAGLPGVYSRNLTLCRLVRGPMVYGESLCQDAESEFAALSRQELTVAGMQAPARLEAVAKAYVAALLAFVRGRTL